MATAYISYHKLSDRSNFGGSVIGRCFYSDVIDLSSEALTPPATDFCVAMISVDADCFFSTGSAPDADAETDAGASSARMFIPANGSIPVALSAAEKIAVKEA